MNKPTSQRFNIKFFLLPLLIALISTLFELLDPQITLALRFDREAILDGEVWRLISGNFVHLGWNHLWMNLAGLFLIWMLFARFFNFGQWLFIIVTSAAAVGGGLLVLNLELNWYVGLSGLLHGMFIAGVIKAIMLGYRAEILLFILLTGKLIWEQISGALPGSVDLAGGNVVVDAHLYGAIAGLICAALLAIQQRFNHSMQN